MPDGEQINNFRERINNTRRRMPTYREIQEYVRQHYRYTPKTCWIAHVKEKHGLTNGPAHNRRNPHQRAHPCPENKIRDIEEALRHFGVIR